MGVGPRLSAPARLPAAPETLRSQGGTSGFRKSHPDSAFLVSCHSSNVG